MGEGAPCSARPFAPQENAGQTGSDPKGSASIRPPGHPFSLGSVPSFLHSPSFACVEFFDGSYSVCSAFFVPAFFGSDKVQLIRTGASRGFEHYLPQCVHAGNRLPDASQVVERCCAPRHAGAQRDRRDHIGSLGEAWSPTQAKRRLEWATQNIGRWCSELCCHGTRTVTVTDAGQAVYRGLWLG